MPEVSQRANSPVLPHCGRTKGSEANSVRITRGPLKGFVGVVIATESGKWLRVQFGGNFAEWMHRSEVEAA